MSALFNKNCISTTANARWGKFNPDITQMWQPIARQSRIRCCWEAVGTNSHWLTYSTETHRQLNAQRNDRVYCRNKLSCSRCAIKVQRTQFPRLCNFRLATRQRYACYPVNIPQDTQRLLWSITQLLGAQHTCRSASTSNTRIYDESANNVLIIRVHIVSTNSFTRRVCVTLNSDNAQISSFTTSNLLVLCVIFCIRIASDSYNSGNSADCNASSCWHTATASTKKSLISGFMLANGIEVAMNPTNNAFHVWNVVFFKLAVFCRHFICGHEIVHEFDTLVGDCTLFK